MIQKKHWLQSLLVRIIRPKLILRNHLVCFVSIINILNGEKTILKMLFIHL